MDIDFLLKYPDGRDVYTMNLELQLSRLDPHTLEIGEQVILLDHELTPNTDPELAEFYEDGLHTSNFNFVLSDVSWEVFEPRFHRRLFAYGIVSTSSNTAPKIIDRKYNKELNIKYINQIPEILMTCQTVVARNIRVGDYITTYGWENIPYINSKQQNVEDVDFRDIHGTILTYTELEIVNMINFRELGG
jgi:hypothetical protein